MPDVLVVRPPRADPPPPPGPPLEVPAPPGRSEAATEGAWAQPLLLSLGSAGGLLFFLIRPSPLYVAAGVLVVLGSIAAAVGMSVQQRRRAARRLHRDRRRYLARLQRVREAATEAARAQRRHAARHHPPPDTLAGFGRGNPRLWERRRTDPDFLTLRVGTGDVPLEPGLVPAPEDPAADEDPVAAEHARRLRARYATLPAAPVTVALRGLRVLALAGDPDRRAACLRALLAQAAVWHAPADLRIVVGAAPDRAAGWEWVKWLPHVGRAPALVRDAAALEDLLRVELTGRALRAGEQAAHLLVVADGLPLPDSGALATLHQTPGLATTVISGVDGVGGLWWYDALLTVPAAGPATLTGTGAFRADGLDPATGRALARGLAPCRLPGRTGTATGAGTDLPALLGVDLGAARPPWRCPEPAPYDLLRVPVGVGPEGEPVHLDLKESAAGGMGPHGLVVGATGSGKSELLRTLVVGLALTHPPELLSAVLVDFKGGATFAGLSGLPHIGGVITNLQDDAGLVQRVHDALHGELLRRQDVLRAAGGLASVADYARLRAGRPDLPPLPRLLVVVDEFSELLLHHPDFAELFAAVGRLGRSLGVHLLIASQRVEEGRLRGLESHISYRVALRTFSAADSSAAIGRPDAVHLPRAPGSAYLSVGPEALRRFDACSVSGPVPAAPTRDRAVAVRPFTATGPAERATAATAGGEAQYAAAVRLLADETRRTHQVWLPPLPARLPLSVLLGEPGPGPGGPRAPGWPAGRLAVPVAVADRPREQAYGPVVLDLSSEAGNLLVVGAPRSGTSTVLRTLALALAATHGPAEVQLYCLDLGGGLRDLAGLPHVGALAARSDAERVRRTVAHVLAVLHRRELEFAELGVESIGHLRRLRAADGPARTDRADVLLAVDGLGVLRADFEDLEPAVLEIAARGLAYGVHLVATARRWGEVRPQLRDAVAGRLELRLNEPAESVVHARLAAAVPAGVPGRCLTADGLHAQVLLPRWGPGPADADAGALRAAVRGLAGPGGPVAPPVRVLPRRVGPGDLPVVPPGQVCLGLDPDGAPVTLDLAAADPLLVLGDPGSGRTGVLRTVLRGLAARHAAGEELATYLVDPRRGLLDQAGAGHVAGYATGAAAATALLAGVRDLLTARLPAAGLDLAALRARDHGAGPPVYVVVDDSDLLEGLAGSPLAELADLVPHAADVGLHVLVARRVAGAARAFYGPALQRLRDAGGPVLVLSGDRAEGPLAGAVTAAPRPPGRGELVRGGRATLVQTVLADPDLPQVSGPPAGPGPGR